MVFLVLVQVLLGHFDLDVHVVVSVAVAAHPPDAFPLEADHLVALATGRNLTTHSPIIGLVLPGVLGRVHHVTTTSRSTRSHQYADGLVQAGGRGRAPQDGLSHRDHHV